MTAFSLSFRGIDLVCQTEVVEELQDATLAKLKTSFLVT